MVDKRAMVARGLILIVACLSLLAVACSGGKSHKNATPEASAPATEQQPAGPEPTPVEIKIPGTGPVVLPFNAALASDHIELARQTGYTSVPCATDQNAQNLGPLCRSGEDAGTRVDAVAEFGCEGSWLRAESVPDAYLSVLVAPPKLYSIFVPKRIFGAFGAGLEGQYVVVMRAGTRPDGSPGGFALHIKDGRIVMLQTVCTSFEALTSPNLVDSIVVPPSP